MCVIQPPLERVSLYVTPLPPKRVLGALPVVTSAVPSRRPLDSPKFPLENGKIAANEQPKTPPPYPRLLASVRTSGRVARLPLPTGIMQTLLVSCWPLQGGGAFPHPPPSAFVPDLLLLPT